MDSFQYLKLQLPFTLTRLRKFFSPLQNFALY
jgi:hypothetical protein